MQELRIFQLDIKCTNVTGVSENCGVGSSHLIYECRKGFKFANNQDSSTFKSVCTKNGWTTVPKCLQGNFNNSKILPIVNYLIKI